MPLSILFWVVMLLWLLFGLWANRTPPWDRVGAHILTWILLAMLGWKVFGPAVQ